MMQRGDPTVKKREGVPVHEAAEIDGTQAVAALRGFSSSPWLQASRWHSGHDGRQIAQ
jgi:hypothetical protein